LNFRFLERLSGGDLNGRRLFARMVPRGKTISSAIQAKRGEGKNEMLPDGEKLENTPYRRATMPKECSA
jgi:hypothetical protein